MKNLSKILILSFVAINVMANMSYSQTPPQNIANEATDNATEAEMYFASGTAVEATNNQIIISEYDFDAGQEIKMTYQVNAQTQLDGVAAVTEIKPGDDIEIEYQLTGEQKIATRIEKYAPEADEMDENDDTANEQAMDEMNMEAEQKLKNEAAAIESNN